MKRSLIELTPLLDVFLILIFAFLVGYKTQNQKVEKKYLSERDSLVSSQMVLESKLSSYRGSLDSTQLKASAMLNQLTEQQELFRQTMIRLSEDFADFFQDSRIHADSLKKSGALSNQDYEKYLESIEELIPENRQEFIRKVFVLKELSSYSTVFDIYLDDENQLHIQNSPTSIMLNDFDERLDDFPEASKKRFTQKAVQFLEAAYQKGQKGKEKFGDIILITFGHGGQSMQGVIGLSKKIAKDFYQQIQQEQAGRKKVLFSDLGYYPL
jgi:biopolymer transport protein ExbD